MRPLAVSILIVLGALALVTTLQGQDYGSGAAHVGVTMGPPPSAGGNAEDFTQRATCIGYYPLTDPNDRGKDYCTTSASEDFTLTDPNGNVTYTTAGVPGGATAAVFPDGGALFTDDDDDVDFDNNETTMICFMYMDITASHWPKTWVNLVSSVGLSFYLRGDSQKGRLNFNGSGIDTTTWTYSASTWYMIAATYEFPGNYYIYVDGVDEKNGSSAYDTDGNTATATFGQDLLGKISSCMYFTGDALTQAEICSICRCGPDGTWTDRSANCNACTFPSGVTQCIP
jgi:hypothetical protein